VHVPYRRAYRQFRRPLARLKSDSTPCRTPVTPPPFRRRRLTIWRDPSCVAACCIRLCRENGYNVPHRRPDSTNDRRAACTEQGLAATSLRSRTRSAAGCSLKSSSASRSDAPMSRHHAASYASNAPACCKSVRSRPTLRRRCVMVFQ